MASVMVQNFCQNGLNASEVPKNLNVPGEHAPEPRFCSIFTDHQQLKATSYWVASIVEPLLSGRPWDFENWPLKFGTNGSQRDFIDSMSSNMSVE